MQKRSLRQKATRFLVVGGLGFCLDLVLLVLLTEQNMSPYVARIVSLSASITLTWIFNRTFSFGASNAHAAVEYGRYALVALIAALVNYGVYAACVALLPAVYAMIAGSIAAIALTFTGYDRWVFAKR